MKREVGKELDFLSMNIFNATRSFGAAFHRTPMAKV